MPLISSSYDAPGVQVRRRAEFDRQVESAGSRLDPSTLFAFHASHAAAPSAYSPCMHRADARTVSFSWIKVTGSEVDFFYSPAAPCQWAPGATQRLPRRVQ